jgi:hypothetical protein
MTNTGWFNMDKWEYVLCQLVQFWRRFRYAWCATRMMQERYPRARKQKMPYRRVEVTIFSKGRGLLMPYRIGMN